MISRERLYLTSDGAVVREGDPRAVTLLVGAGGELADSEAQRYGLLNNELQQPLEEKSVEAAPENKAVEFPPENKRTRKR